MTLGYRRITIDVSLLDARRNSGEINDHRPEEIRDTEFGLPPSNMKGAFGNEGALRFVNSSVWSMDSETISSARKTRVLSEVVAHPQNIAQPFSRFRRLS